VSTQGAGQQIEAANCARKQAGNFSAPSVILAACVLKGLWWVSERFLQKGGSSAGTKPCLGFAVSKPQVSRRFFGVVARTLSVRFVRQECS